MTNQPSQPLSLGKYELLEKIGEGGYGIVYRGRDPLLDRIVAIKVLRSDLASNPDFIERFRREARLAASLRHPNIVTVIEIGEQNGSYYLVMDYLPGGSLQQLLEPGKPLPLARAVELLKPVAEALDYAHSRQMIHRDIKPGNILFSDDGSPVISDFGLVKSTAQESITTTGVTLGTVEYMAPEQIQGLEIGPAADLYALGVMAYQLLAGQTPFRGNTPFEVQSGHVNQPPPDPRQNNPGLPGEVVKSLMKSLAKKTEGRYPSARGFMIDLEKQANQLTKVKLGQLVADGKAAMGHLEFDTAIEKLEQAQTIQSDDYVETLLIQCQKRKSICEEVNGLRQQKEEIDRRLSEIMETEIWLKPPSTDYLKAYFPGAERISKNDEPDISRKRPADSNFQLKSLERSEHSVDSNVPLKYYESLPNNVRKWIRDNPQLTFLIILLATLLIVVLANSH